LCALVLATGTAFASDIALPVSVAGNVELVLTVSGPDGYYLQQRFDAGAAPAIPAIDGNGIPLRDGSYTWQVVAEPILTPDVRDALDKARATGNYALVAQLRDAGKIPESSVQSGYLQVVGGQAVIPEAEPITQSGDADVATPKDQVILDDLIVDGSLCVGFDCVNGESFGFDTIRVKENNLRIKFDDTSTAASFPRNDWQLTANDSANGGASKFSIDDISGSRTPFTVEANARSHSLYVDDGGRIGSRTSTPSTEIHTIDGDTPTLRLQQDGSSGFAPQTWDVAGNETNFFIRDVTNGSQLPFRIRPDAPTSSIFIDTTGYVGLNTSSPDTLLHLEDNEPVILTMKNTTTNGADWRFNSANNGTFRFSDEGDTDVEFSLNEDGDLTITGSLTANGSTFPDYVFEPDYQLMPLDELASFIAQNKHLPSVPKADQVDGGKRINMTELQVKLLEKVEELTLYTLSQQETINSQQQMIEEFHARLAALEGAEQ
jgi:hypothetical protein